MRVRSRAVVDGGLKGAISLAQKHQDSTDAQDRALIGDGQVGLAVAVEVGHGHESRTPCRAERAWRREAGSGTTAGHGGLATKQTVKQDGSFVPDMRRPLPKPWSVRFQDPSPVRSSSRKTSPIMPMR